MITYPDKNRKAGIYGDVVLWSLEGLAPSPEEEWQKLKAFLAINDADKTAMTASVDILLKHAHELVVAVYDYLLSHQETAALLGWEKGQSSNQLAERRRFFSLWLARMLGLDLSDDFAHFLFKVGKVHAGHGPRHIHIPEAYVQGAVAMVQAGFAKTLATEMSDANLLAYSLAAWNKVLQLHTHLMLHGYRMAVALDQGDIGIRTLLFGSVRSLARQQELRIQLPKQSTINHLLKKFFNYYPELRSAAFEREWHDKTVVDAEGRTWLEFETCYRVKPAWRVLVNGLDIEHGEGLNTSLNLEDEVCIFPPGR
ncbi:MAG: protoglobin domain-containing protein [Deinococcales bacterium]